MGEPATGDPRHFGGNDHFNHEGPIRKCGGPIGFFGGPRSFEDPTQGTQGVFGEESIFGELVHESFLMRPTYEKNIFDTETHQGHNRGDPPYRGDNT